MYMYVCFTLAYLTFFPLKKSFVRLWLFAFLSDLSVVSTLSCSLPLRSCDKFSLPFWLDHRLNTGPILRFSLPFLLDHRLNTGPIMRFSLLFWLDHRLNTVPILRFSLPFWLDHRLNTGPILRFSLPFCLAHRLRTGSTRNVGLPFWLVHRLRTGSTRNVGFQILDMAPVSFHVHETVRYGCRHVSCNHPEPFRNTLHWHFASFSRGLCQFWETVFTVAQSIST